MKILSKIIFLAIVIAIIFSFYKINQGEEKQKNYEKCVSACSSVVENELEAVKSCMDKCEEKFLGGSAKNSG